MIIISTWVIAILWPLSTIIFFIVLHKYLIKSYVDIINELNSENTKLLEFLAALQRRSAESFLEIKKVDKRGSFSSDDEVGFVFNFLKSNVEDIKNFLDDHLNKD